MATVYSKVTDNAAVEGTQDPADLDTLIDAVTGITGDEELATDTVGGTTTVPNMGFAGAIATIDDVTYVDGADGLVGAADAARFQPGLGYSTGFRRENESVIADTQLPAATALSDFGPTGKSADFDLID